MDKPYMMTKKDLLNIRILLVPRKWLRAGVSYSARPGKAVSWQVLGAEIIQILTLISLEYHDWTNK